jgi:hypothetical protein
MEKKDKYLTSKRNYNSKLSTFQIDKELHSLLKKYCFDRNIKVKDFLQKLISEKINEN